MSNLGPFAKPLSRVVALGAAVGGELTFLTDALRAGIGSIGSTDISVTIDTDAPGAVPVESFYQSWSVHGGGVDFRPDGTGDTYGHDGFTPRRAMGK